MVPPGNGSVASAKHHRSLAKRISMAAGATATVLDSAHLERQTFGDPALEREVIALFEGQCTRLAPMIAGAGDGAERRDAAHTLKGAARAVGAWAVVAAAEAIESALEEDEAAERLASLACALGQAIAAVRLALAARERDRAA